MLNKLQIKGFRKNKELDIEFDKITVIRGASGSGKTSLVGALKWICFNQPSSDSFINWEMDFAAVRLFFDDKHKLIRKRDTGQQNYYKLDKQTYKAFGTGVPDDISSLLEMNTLNYHRQHAGPFWFSQTAGEVSRQLNKIVNLDIIDTTTSKLLKDQRDTNTLIKDIEIRITDIRKEKISLRYVLKMDKDLVVLEKQEKQIIQITQNALSLSKLVQTHITTLKTIDNAGERASDAAIAMSKGRLYSNLKSKHQKLLDLIESAQNYKKQLEFDIPDIESVIMLYNEFNFDKNHHERLTELFGRAEDYEEAEYTWQTEARTLEKEFTKLIGKRCPLCQSKIK